MALVRISDVLADAGLSSGAISYWWNRRRRELGNLTPREAALAGRTRQVIQLAEADVAGLAHVG